MARTTKARTNSTPTRLVTRNAVPGALFCREPIATERATGS